MGLLEDLYQVTPDGEVIDVCVGYHWTAVVVMRDGEKHCGLASTLAADHSHQRRSPDVPDAGTLTSCSALDLAGRVLWDQSAQISIGLATINALLPVLKEAYYEANAEEVIARRGAEKRVVLVGHFPFTERLRNRVGELAVLEQNPGPTDYPADQAPFLIPQADVVAITAMSLMNHTLDDLLVLCAPKAFVILLGPSTPLHPVLFDYGIDVISGAKVNEIEPVMRVVKEGGNFRQVHRVGVSLVNMKREEL